MLALLLPSLLVSPAEAHGGPGFPWVLLPAYDEPIPLSTTPADQGGVLESATEDWVFGPEPRPGAVDVTFVVGPDGIAEGGGIKLTLGQVLPTAQRVYTPFSLNVASATFFGISLLRDAEAESSNPEVRLRVREPKAGRSFFQLLRYVRYKRTDDGRTAKDNLLRQIDNEHALRVEVTRGALRPGDRIRVRVGGADGIEPPNHEASWQIIARVDGDGDGTFGLPPGKPPSFDAYTTEVAEVELVAPSSLHPGQRTDMTVRVTDDWFLPNLARFGGGELRLDPVPGLAFPTSIPLPGTPGSWEGSVVSVPVAAEALGVYRITGTAVIDGRSYPVRSNPVEVIRPEVPGVYFGDVHLHSILSYDADRTPAYVYWRQRHQERHDFMALTDHDMIGTVPFATRDGARGLTEDEWAYMKQLADERYEPGRFVTLKAYEWTSYYFGHRNVIFSADEADPPLFHHNWPAAHEPGDELLPGELQAALARDQHRYLAIPHSTAWPTKSVLYHWGPGDAREDRFGDPTAWPEQRVLELYSTHGASEFFDNETAVDKGHPEAPTESALVRSLLNYDIQQAPADSGNFARDALAAGWRFGFIGSSDDHYLSHLDQAYRYGLAAVFSPELTRRGIWDGLWARTTYAVTGERILVRWSVNGAPMGTIQRARGPIANRVEVHGTHALDRVEIACWDGAAWTTPWGVDAAGALDLVTEVTLPQPTAGSLCYLRVRQQDTNRAWTSPVWFE